MKGLDLLSVLLLFLSWRRLCFANQFNFHRTRDHHHNHHDHEEMDFDVSSWLDGAVENNDNDIHVNAIRHKILFPRLAMRERLRNSAVRQGLSPKHHHPESRDRERSSGPTFLKTQLIRHTAHIMDEFLSESESNFTLITHPGPHHYHNHSGLENLTISQLIENLRGLRARRRRSSIANSKWSLELAKKGIGKDRPSKKVAEIDGQIVLGGLMMVHERGKEVTCGHIMPQVSFFLLVPFFLFYSGILFGLQSFNLNIYIYVYNTMQLLCVPGTFCQQSMWK